MSQMRISLIEIYLATISEVIVSTAILRQNMVFEHCRSHVSSGDRFWRLLLYEKLD